jgi:hypothetical protein
MPRVAVLSRLDTKVEAKNFAVPAVPHRSRYRDNFVVQFLSKSVATRVHRLSNLTLVLTVKQDSQYFLFVSLL